MNIFIWIVFGGIVGWVATVLTGSDSQFGILGNIIIGIVGAYLGGWVSSRVIKGPPVTGFDLRSFIIAVLGSVLFIWILNLLF